MSGIDPNALLCLHCDGTNGGTSFPDASQYGRTVTVTGGANTDTSQSQFGTASCRVGTGSNDWIGDTSLNYSFGTGDFTVDMWLRFNSVASQCAIFSDSNNSEVTFDIEFVPGSGVRIQYNAGTQTTFAWTPSTATWYHWALVRASSVSKVYIDGTALTGSFSNTDNLAACGLQFGQRATGATQFNGWIDEIRVSNIARWTTNFTRPSAAYSQNFPFVPYQPWAQLGPILAQRQSLNLRKLWRGFRLPRPRLLVPRFA